MKVCPQCGNYLHDGFAICPRDGAQIFTIDVTDSPVTMDSIPAPSKSNRASLKATVVKADQKHFWRTSTILPIAIGLVIMLAGGAYVANNHQDRDAALAKQSVDDLIKQGEYNRALTIMQRWRDQKAETALDAEKMDKLLVSMAVAASKTDDNDRAIMLLKKVAPGSSHYAEATKLLRQLQKN